MPNTSRLFGSTYMITFTNKCPQRTSNHNQVIYITKHHIKALDQPTQRCDGKTPSINTSACIADFIEKQIGCNTMIQGSQYSTGDRCTAKSDLLALANMAEVFQNADGNDIHDTTGCMFSCEKDHYGITAEPVECRMILWGTPEFHLMFKIMERSYREEEEYIIYDKGSFIADVGGYMGLLLGCSLMSLYTEMEVFLKKIFCRPQSLNGINLC